MVPPSSRDRTDGGRTWSPNAAEPAVLLDDVAAQRLGEALRSLPDLLEQKWGASPRSMSRRDLGLHDLLGTDRQRRAVVGQPHDPVELPGRHRGRGHDLTVAEGLIRMRRRLAVHADVVVRDLDQAVQLAGDDRQVVGEPDVHAWPLPRSASSTRSGSSALAAAMATEPSKVLTVRRNASTRPARRASRDTRAGMTFASVVIGDGMASAAAPEGPRGCRRRRSARRRRTAFGVDGAVTGVLVAVDRVGVRLGDDADTGPAGVAEHGNPRQAQRERDAADRRP